MTYVPDVMHRHITAEEAAAEMCVVIASDGVWDCWKYEDFSEFVNEQTRKKALPIGEAGEVCLNESVTRAVANFGAKHYDDASVVFWRIGANEQYPVAEDGMPEDYPEPQPEVPAEQ